MADSTTELRGLRVAILSALFTGCATNPQHVATDHTISVQQEAIDDWGRTVLAQTDDPAMIAYIAQVCAQPQPEKSRLANDLIRTHHIVLVGAFDKDNPMDMEAAAQAGQAVITPCPPAGEAKS